MKQTVAFNLTAFVSVVSQADTFINKERTKIYALLAGAMVWPMSRDVASLSCDDPQAIARDVNVNVCEGLDWKRVFAVHMW